MTRHSQSSALSNMFDSLPSLSTPKQSELRNELDRYLSSDPEAVEDVLMWWHGSRAAYPYLSRMALDYLTIPGTFFHLSNTPLSTQATPYKQHLLTSSDCSAVAALSYPMSVVGCQRSQLGPCSVWDLGAYRA
jgi:hypothetical protein